LITTSIDGHVKFWKKKLEGIDFIKHYRAHLSVIVSAAVSSDATLFVTASADKALKVFDIINFDMINMFQLDYLPNVVCWIYTRNIPLLAWLFCLT
jgi:peptidylprolyl isomerase domain and WD repeat-containing protein 1